MRCYVIRCPSQLCEGVTIETPLVVLLCELAFSSLPPHASLLGYTEPLFRRRFASLVKSFYLDPAAVKPYSLRRGGATAHYKRHLNMELTCLQGRWATTKSARVYIQEAMAQQAALDQSSAELAQLEYYQQVVDALLRH